MLHVRQIRPPLSVPNPLTVHACHWGPEPTVWPRGGHISLLCSTRASPTRGLGIRPRSHCQGSACASPTLLEAEPTNRSCHSIYRRQRLPAPLAHLLHTGTASEIWAS